MPPTTGRVSFEGFRFDDEIATSADPLGFVFAKAQIGWSPFGAETVTRIREPFR